MKTIVFTDPHITLDSIEELDNVFSEINDLSTYYKANRIICLGDYYHRTRLHPKELDFGTYEALRLAKDKEFIMIKGNHPAIDDNNSSVTYLEHVGIKVVEQFIDNNMFFGHFMTEDSSQTGRQYVAEAPTMFDKYEKYVKDIKHYDLVLLGHQHNFQKLDSHIFHLGSCRWVSFGEVADTEKYITIIDNEKFNFLPLLSPIPMVDVDSVDKLIDIDNQTKVRLIFKSFKQFKYEINKIGSFKNKFVDFKIKLDFITEHEKIETSNKSTHNIIKEWLDNIIDDDIRTLLKEQFGDITCIGIGETKL